MRSQDFDRFERDTWQAPVSPPSRPLMDSERAVRQFVAGGLTALAFVGVGYGLAQVTGTDTTPHRTSAPTTTTR